MRVSQATRLAGSSFRQASRMASEIWSAILSGCPSVTDSDVKRKRFRFDKTCAPHESLQVLGGKSRVSGKPGLGRWSVGSAEDGEAGLRLLKGYQSTPAPSTISAANGALLRSNCKSLQRKKLSS